MSLGWSARKAVELRRDQQALARAPAAERAWAAHRRELRRATARGCITLDVALVAPFSASAEDLLAATREVGVMLAWVGERLAWMRARESAR